MIALGLFTVGCEDGGWFIWGRPASNYYYECQCPEGDTVWDDCEEEAYDNFMDCFDGCEMLGGHCECIGDEC